VLYATETRGSLPCLVLLALADLFFALFPGYHGIPSDYEDLL